MLAWEFVKTKFDLGEDFYKVDKELKYLWNNLGPDGQRILARLDRVNVFQGLNPQLSRIIDKYRIRDDIGLSNHILVSLFLKL